MAVLVYAEHIDNPVVEAMSRFAEGEPALNPDGYAMLLDQASGLMRMAGPEFASTGVLASYERDLPRGNHVRISYANGNALVIENAPGGSPNLVQLLAAARPRRAQTYAISLSGTLDGSGTRWQASYRWQPEDTVTPVASYAVNAAEPYLNLHVRQPLHRQREGATGIDALLDVRNMLEQGYRPYLMSDGSLFIFAQEQRGIRGGLAFTF
jgi:hypothetical protein